MPNNADWKLTGFSPVRKFLWALLQQELGWDKKNYGGLVPITTPQQQAEFVNTNAPYIVTGSVIDQNQNLSAIVRETTALAIYATDDDDILQVGNLVRAYFGEQDLSAQWINDWNSVNGSEGDRRFEMKTISVLSAETADPTKQEGGRYDATIVIRFEYVQLTSQRHPLYSTQDSILRQTNIITSGNNDPVTPGVVSGDVYIDTSDGEVYVWTQ